MSSATDVHSNQPQPPLRLDVSDTDDQRVVREQVHEEYTNHVVPPTARLPRRSVLASWSSIASAMAFVYYGALAATLVGITQAVIGIVLTCLGYSIIAAVGGAKAIRNGLNSTLMSRELFGVKGAAVCPLIIAFGGVFYAVFEGSVLASALQTYFGAGDIRIWYVVVVVGTLPLMLGGMQTWLGKLNGISLPVYFFGLVAAVVVAGVRFGWEGQWDQFDAPASTTGIPGWLTVVILFMGVWLLFPELQDAARMARQEDARFHLNVTFGVVFWALAYLFNGVVGIVIIGLAAGQPGVEPTELGAVQGVVAALGLVGLIVILVSQVRINTANFYFLSISAERFVSHFSRRNLKRRAWVLISAGVVLVIMFTNIFSYVTTALAWLGVLVASWIGIQLVGWAFDRGAEVEFRPRRLKTVGPGLYLWLVATVIGVALVEVGPRLPTLSALSPLVAFAIAVVGYAVMRLLGATAHRPVTGDPVREQVGDLWGSRVRCHHCDRSYVAIEMDIAADGETVECLRCQTA